MKIRAFQELYIFLSTARLGSLSAAARELDLTPAVTSAAVKRLEGELGVQLFIRTTRKLRLTPEGEAFQEHAEQAVSVLQAGIHQLREGGANLSGVLNLSAPSDLGRNRVLQWLDDFMEQHPALQVRLQLSDSVADLYGQQVDVALRYGPLPDSSMVAIPIAPDNRRILCASPAYLERMGQPESPRELSTHNCLCFMLHDATHARWSFSYKEQPVSVRVRGNRMANDGDAVRRWALAGAGIAYKSELDIREELERGELIRLCPEWEGEASPLNLMCAHRSQLSPAVRALSTFLREACR